jgi:hemerythrin
MYQITKDLETGNTMIDTQHKELFNAINNLLEACSKGKGREQIQSTITFLADYTNKHFGDEEALQRKYNYPDYIKHKQYHEGFKMAVKAINEEFQKQGATIALVGKINTNVGNWLVNHIKREDVKVAAHIRSMQ